MSCRKKDCRRKQKLGPEDGTFFSSQHNLFNYFLGIVRDPATSRREEERVMMLLFEKEPTNATFRFITAFASYPWRRKAWRRLLKQKPTKDDLLYVILKASEKWATLAWEELRKQGPTEDNLTVISNCCDYEKLGVEARELRSKMGEHQNQ